MFSELPSAASSQRGMYVKFTHYTGNGAASRLINIGFPVKWFQILYVGGNFGVTGGPDDVTPTTANVQINSVQASYVNAISTDGQSLDVGAMALNVNAGVYRLQAYG